MVFEMKLITKLFGKKDKDYREAKADKGSLVKTAAPYAAAAAATGMASYPQSEGNPIYMNIGIPGHSTTENFLNGALHSIGLLDSSSELNMPPITPYIAGALLYAGFSKAKSNSEKKVRMFEKIENMISDEINRELEDAQGLDFLEAQNIYENVRENAKSGISKKGLIFKSEEEKLAKFVAKNPAMYIKFADEILDSLKNPETVLDTDMKHIIGRIAPYVSQKEKYASINEKIASEAQELENEVRELTEKNRADKIEADKKHAKLVLSKHLQEELHKYVIDSKDSSEDGFLKHAEDITASDKADFQKLANRAGYELPDSFFEDTLNEAIAAYKNSVKQEMAEFYKINAEYDAMLAVEEKKTAAQPAMNEPIDIKSEMAEFYRQNKAYEKLVAENETRKKARKKTPVEKAPAKKRNARKDKTQQAAVEEKDVELLIVQYKASGYRIKSTEEINKYLGIK